jgi:hypothetical protein
LKVKIPTLFKTTSKQLQKHFKAHFKNISNHSKRLPDTSKTLHPHFTPASNPANKIGLSDEVGVTYIFVVGHGNAVPYMFTRRRPS